MNADEADIQRHLFSDLNEPKHKIYQLQIQLIPKTRYILPTAKPCTLKVEMVGQIKEVYFYECYCDQY